MGEGMEGMGVVVNVNGEEGEVAGTEGMGVAVTVNGNGGDVVHGWAAVFPSMAQTAPSTQGSAPSTQSSEAPSSSVAGLYSDAVVAVVVAGMDDGSEDVVAAEVVVESG